jgi:hypothetical protein
LGNTASSKTALFTAASYPSYWFLAQDFNAKERSSEGSEEDFFATDLNPMNADVPLALSVCI